MVGLVQAGKLVAFGPKDEIIKEPARPIPMHAVAGGLRSGAASAL